MGLKAALQKLDEAVKDLTSLHVQTFSGELNITLSGDKGYDTLRAEMKKAIKEGNLTLVAETLAQFDGDSYNFVKQDLSDIPSIALEVHKNAVEAGIETRLGLLGLFKGLIK
ncbi:MAG: hypothetical protein PSN34_12060 [Urechidicola sp.]|nr:hypothetical protein [Urechidicola sp.]